MTYTSDAVGRLTGQFHASHKLRALVAAMVSMFDTMEIVAGQLRDLRWIDTATGKQLDGCGYIVGEYRRGKTDDEYRTAIKYRVFVNTSKGTPQDLIYGLRYLTSPVDSQYLEAYPATALLFTDGYFVPHNIQSQMQDLAPVGISNVPVAVSFADKPFRFASQPPPGELFVENDSKYLTANDADIQVSTGDNATKGIASLGGVSTSDLGVGSGTLAVAGEYLAIAVPNSGALLGHYNLTGVYQ